MGAESQLSQSDRMRYGPKYVYLQSQKLKAKINHTKRHNCNLQKKVVSKEKKPMKMNVVQNQSSKNLVPQVDKSCKYFKSFSELKSSNRLKKIG